MVRDVQKRLEEREVTFQLTTDAQGLGWPRKASTRSMAPGLCAAPFSGSWENPFARMVLSGEVTPGDHVIVDASPDGLVFSKQGSQGSEISEPLEVAVV